MRAQVKICGITGADALLAVLDAGADACGFVFHEQSPRHLSFDRVAQLAARAPHLLKVGVFVDAGDDRLAAAVQAGRLGALQLQGSESPERVAEVRGRFGLPVWKAVGVRTAAEVRAAAARFAGADRLLLDAKPMPGMELPGGNGLRFDWRILHEAKPAMLWALAGGLDAGNVAEAIRQTGAPMVDVSSGVEASPGVKDVAKIAAFVKAARRA